MMLRIDRPSLRAALLARRIGSAPLAVAAALSALALAALLSATDAWVAATDAERALHEARAAQAAPARAVDGASVSAQRLQAFYAVLGDDREAESYLRQVHFGLQQAGLQFTHVDYRRTENPAARTIRLTVELTAYGPYPAVRGFLDEMQVRLPFLALDELEYRREAIGSVEGEAAMRLSLHLRPSEAPR